MNILGATKFDQCVINISLINICNQESYLGSEMRKLYNAYQDEIDEAVNNPWEHLHKFVIYVPHPQQEYENISLEEGLTKGYNVEVELIEDKSLIPYKIPEGGHFVVVLKQTALNGDFKIAATGIFIRPLGVLSLDVVVDADAGEYQPLLIKHPIIRNYPEDWQNKLVSFLNKEIHYQDLPNVVGYVDQAVNRDYRSPSWNEVFLSSQGFAGF
ncbi:hypothetical protein [Gloeothece verrucosa]|uniref:Uncharacterized protein n=1 Tax=Gloeothece verrucosa (strain PCC 7822) TaxID=497965 RepID=E0UIA3_GLOV7|nr:hypothetical protein [Gloeothece verrucosa]ADN16871.1 hypothetical protein Cyan7822_4981 [Gloeothece verrucosa PCC 7822]